MIKTTVATVVGIGTLIGMAFTVDSVYIRESDAAREHLSEAQISEQLHQGISLKREEGDLRTQLQILTLQIKHTEAKEIKTSDDIVDLEFAREQRRITQERIQELQK